MRARSYDNTLIRKQREEGSMICFFWWRERTCLPRGPCKRHKPDDEAYDGPIREHRWLFAPEMHE